MSYRLPRLLKYFISGLVFGIVFSGEVGAQTSLPWGTCTGTNMNFDTVQSACPGGSITGYSNMKVGPGLINLEGTTGSTLTGFSSDGQVSVKAMGAIGNGVANDTAAIQAAHDAAGSTKCVYFPAGTYLVTSDLNWTSSTSGTWCVVGDDPSTTVIQCNDPGGNCFDASGTDAFSMRNIRLIGGTPSGGNAPRVTLLLARTGNQGIGSTLTNVWVANNGGPYSIYDYGAEVSNWYGVRSQPGAVDFSECNNVGVASRFQTLVPPPTSMSTVNVFGGQFWAGGSVGNRCAFIFDAACGLQSPPPGAPPLHIYAAVHDINFYSPFLGEMQNGANASAPTAAFCDTPGSDNSILTSINISGVRMEAGDTGANYTFADFSNSYLASVNFRQTTLATTAVTGNPLLTTGGCIDTSWVDLQKGGFGLTPGVFAIQAPCGRNDDFIDLYHAQVPRVLFAGLSGLGDTGNRFSWFDGSTGHYDAGGFEGNALGTSVAGPTAGSVVWTQPAHSVSYHTVSMSFMGYQNNTATGQVIVYPIQFDQAPAELGGCPAGMNLTNGTQAVLPPSMGAPFTGQCILAGQ